MHVSRICSDLVKIRSENPPGRTDEVIEYIRVFLERSGYHIPMYPVIMEGMCNLVTRKTGKHLLLAGMLMSSLHGIPHGRTRRFPGESMKSIVHGRGSTDMKGGCASILSACETMVNAGHELPATLVFVCDEETGGENGIRRLLADRLISPADCLIAEPTPSRHPAIGQKGLCRLELEFTGIPAHGSLYPAVGVSAIMEAMALIEYVHELHTRDYPVSPDLEEILSRSAEVLREEFDLKGVSDILRHLTYNPGTIHGGEKSNVVAEHCILELEMRVPWGCSIPELKSEIMAHAKNATIVLQETHESFDDRSRQHPCYHHLR